jgi:hypothetical protein
MMNKLQKLLKEWNEKPRNPLIRPHRTMDDAEDLIHALQVELAGKDAVIKMLQDDGRIESLIDKLDFHGIPFDLPPAS